MKIAFIGIGNVGFALANRLQQIGHEIIVASNDITSETVQKALQNNPNFSVMGIQEAVDAVEVVFLATPFQANEEILQNIQFNQQVLVDCTNPVGPGISHGLGSEISGAEKVQQWAPNTRVVKAFTIYGFENFVNNHYPDYGVKPVMMIAGNEAQAKSIVSQLNRDLDFETLDVGPLEMALHLEHLTLLWVKMVRRDGHHPNFVWAHLTK